MKIIADVKDEKIINIYMRGDDCQLAENQIDVTGTNAQAGWMIIDDVAVDPASLEAGFDEQQLASQKQITLTNIVDLANQFTAPILAKYPQAETAGWSQKQAECQAIVTAADADQDIAPVLANTIIMKTIAAQAGLDNAAVEATARAVIAKAGEFAQIAAIVEVMREQAIAAVDAASDMEELDATKTQLMTSASALAAQFGLG